MGGQERKDEEEMVGDVGERLRGSQRGEKDESEAEREERELQEAIALSLVPPASLDVSGYVRTC